MTALGTRSSAATRFAVDQIHDINVTPFIDVMLVLLIVFIIATPLATTAIQLDIAAGHSSGGASTPASLLIDDRGALSIATATGIIATSLDRLARDLPAATGSDAAHSWVVVSGAARTRYGAFVAVMDRLHADGFTNVTLAAKSA